MHLRRYQWPRYACIICLWPARFAYVIVFCCLATVVIWYANPQNRSENSEVVVLYGDVVSMSQKPSLLTKPLTSESSSSQLSVPFQTLSLISTSLQNTATPPKFSSKLTLISELTAVLKSTPTLESNSSLQSLFSVYLTKHILPSSSTLPALIPPSLMTQNTRPDVEFRAHNTTSLFNSSTASLFRPEQLRISQLPIMTKRKSRVLHYSAVSPASMATASNCQSMLDALQRKPGITEFNQLEKIFTALKPLVAKYKRATNFSDDALIKYTFSMLIDLPQLTNFSLGNDNLNYDILASIDFNCLTFFINELRKNDTRSKALPRGGSSFHTIIEGPNTIAYCPYVDFDNDSYSIFCPLHERCAKVTIHLLYYDYIAYSPLKTYLSVNRVIYSELLCNENIALYYPLPNLFWERIKSVGDKPKAEFGWILRRKDSYLLTSEQFKQCMKQRKMSLDFIGDSHSRLIAYHLARLRGQPTGISRLYASKNYGRLYYYFAPFVLPQFLTQLRSTLLQLRNQSSSTSLTTIVLDVGTWDLARRDVFYLAFKAMPTLRTHLITMQREGLFQNVRLLFYDMPPTPLWLKRKIDKRNPVALAAGNKLLADVLQEVNITLVEYFALARLFINETAPNDMHYLQTNSTSSYGHVGIAITNYLLGLICETNHSNWNATLNILNQSFATS